MTVDEFHSFVKSRHRGCRVGVCCGGGGHIPEPLRLKGNDVTLAQTTLTH